jgi:hypothetical protein
MYPDGQLAVDLLLESECTSGTRERLDEKRKHQQMNAARQRKQLTVDRHDEARYRDLFVRTLMLWEGCFAADALRIR